MQAHAVGWLRRVGCKVYDLQGGGHDAQRELQEGVWDHDSEAAQCTIPTARPRCA